MYARVQSLQPDDLKRYICYLPCSIHLQRHRRTKAADTLHRNQFPDHQYFKLILSGPLTLGLLHAKDWQNNLMTASIGCGHPWPTAQHSQPRERPATCRAYAPATTSQCDRFSNPVAHCRDTFVGARPMSRCLLHRHSGQPSNSSASPPSIGRRPLLVRRPKHTSGRLYALPVEHIAHVAAHLAQLDHQSVLADGHADLQQFVQHMSLAYERVTLPCSSMNCGDAIYRRLAQTLIFFKLICTMTRVENCCIFPSFPLRSRSQCQYQIRLH